MKPTIDTIYIMEMISDENKLESTCTEELKLFQHMHGLKINWRKVFYVADRFLFKKIGIEGRTNNLTGFAQG